MKLDTPVKVIASIDTGLLDKVVQSIVPEHWTHYDYRQPNANMADCNSILIRHSSEYATATIRDMPLYPAYDACMRDILSVLSQHYDFYEWVSFIAKLRAGGVVGVHQDSGEFLERIHRVHIPLVTNPECLYMTEAGGIHMARGVIYEIDNMREHGVQNNGTEDRLQLVVNLYPKA